MSQTTVNSLPLRAFEGMVADKPERETSGLASALIYFGKGISVSATVGLDDEPPIVNPYASGEVFHGIAGADVTVERMASAAGVPNQAPYGAFLAKTSVRIIRKGRVWVLTADAVDDLTKSVFIRNATPGGSPPLETLGSFRATTVANYIDLGALFPVAWVGGTTIGGANFGLLEVSLP